MQVKEDFKALYEAAGFGSIRYPGGTISNLFKWKTSIGPVEERKDQIHGFYNYTGQSGIAPNFGLDELGAFTEEVGSEIVYVYSLGRGNAQDAADLIEYLNARVGTNPNGGVDWAAVRAANGHEEPYNVRYFEIGNEMQQAWNADGTGSQGYWTINVSAGAETAYIDGGTAVFSQQYAVCEEDWNAEASKSTGEANMVRYMRYANLNPKMYDKDGNVVDDPSFRAVNDDVSVYVGGTQWTIVDSFDASGASDRHVVVDYSTGAIRFGDGQKGAIPAAGLQITVSYSVERQGFLNVSKAIKETVARINEIEGTDHEAHVYSSFETAGFISKMAERGADEWYDGLTIHPYSGTPVCTIPRHTFVVLKIDPVGEIDTTPVVSGFTADRAELPTRGGEVTVAVTGRNLTDGILVQCGDTTISTTGNSNGTITSYDIQVSDDGVTFRSVGTGTWEANSEWKYAAFPSAHVKYVRLVALDAVSDNAYVFASAAEIRLTGEKADAHAHSFGDWTVITAPTCTEAGVEACTCECGEREIREIAPLGHTEEVIPAVAATCTGTGLTEGRKCAVCGEILAAQEEVPALGHAWKGTKCVNCDTTRENPFVDVPEDSFYIDPVLWAVEKGITNGISATEFGPYALCNRAQVVTFLYRAMGG